MNIHQNIYNLRKQKNMTMEQLAKKVNTSKQTIARYENGDIANIPYDKVVRLAEAFNVTPGFLMGWMEKDPSVTFNEVADYILRRDENRDKLVTIAGKLSEDNLHKVIDIAEALLLTQTDDKH